MVFIMKKKGGRKNYNMLNPRLSIALESPEQKAFVVNTCKEIYARLGITNEAIPFSILLREILVEGLEQMNNNN